MDAEDLIVDDAGEGQVIEHVGEVMPYCRVAVFARAFGVEAVGLGDAARFVVASDEVDALRVAEFEADEEGDCFDAEEAAVDVVPEEEIVGVGTVAANLEDLNHVEELSVYVSHYRHRREDVHDIALLHQQLFRFGAYCFNDRVGEEFLAVEAGDALVEVDAGRQTRHCYVMSSSGASSFTMDCLRKARRARSAVLSAFSRHVKVVWSGVLLHVKHGGGE